MTTYHFYNKYHYGDNILNLKFLNNIKMYLEKYDITIYYYYNPYYIKNVLEINKYIHTDRIKLNTLDYIPKNSIELWMGIIINNEHITTTYFDTYFNTYYNRILSLLNINHTIYTSIYQDEPYLIDIYNSLNDKYKDIDILILNSEPQSGQYKYDKVEWDNMCIALNNKYNVVTTTFVNNDIKCTFNDRLCIQDIGAISTHCKYIIGVHSGPMTACYNIYTKNNVKQWFIFTDSNIRHNDIDVLNKCTIDCVYVFLIKN